MFGRKGLMNSQSELLDEIDPDNPDHIAWVKQTSDPVIWHEVAMAILLFRGDETDFLGWLVERDDLDRTTAAMMFLAKNNGPDILGDKRLHPDDISPPDQASERRIRHVITRLCERDRGATYPDHGIGLPEGWEIGRKEALKALADNPTCPHRLLSFPIPSQSQRQVYHDIGEGELYSEAYLREHMPFMFG